MLPVVNVMSIDTDEALDEEEARHDDATRHVDPGPGDMQSFTDRADAACFCLDLAILISWSEFSDLDLSELSHKVSVTICAMY